jgi:2-keto-3-deoxy-L-rhamnonate aldolase RhmA
METIIIDNNIDNIKTYDSLGVSRIFIDLEVNNKKQRQGHLDTVISEHTIKDIRQIKPILNNAKILVRINPIYKGTKGEIEAAIKNGADVLMLPMFKTKQEVELFIQYINKRVKACLLLETSQALCRIDDILEVKGIDEIYIGLNDLHISMGLHFMFELLSDGIIEYLTNKIKKQNIPFGIGGVAKMDGGLLPGNIVLKEYIRLGASMVILSRAFKQNLKTTSSTFEQELRSLHCTAEKAKLMNTKALEENKKKLKELVKTIIINIKKH